MNEKSKNTFKSRKPLKLLLVKTSTPGAAYRPPSPPAVIAPLGIMYLASSIRKLFRDKVKVEVESLSTAVEKMEDIYSFIESHSPDIVGISSTLSEEIEAIQVCRAAKNLENKPLVVLGGPYPSCDPLRALTSTGADYAIIGEGEIPFTNFIKSIMNDKNIEDTPAIAYLKGKNLKINPRVFVENLDSIPHPAWDLIPINSYSRLFNMNDMPLNTPPYVPIITSRGCPYKCSFCHNIFGKIFRARSAENVIEEMSILYKKFGVREFHIVDDIFNFDGKRMEKICNMIIRSKMDISLAFPNALRGDLLTKKQIKLLKQAGCYSITMSVESVSPRIQKLMRKKLNIQKVVDNVCYASSLGMITSCFAIIGYPGETIEEMTETVDWLKKSIFDFPRISIASPFPDTLMGEHAKKLGMVPQKILPDMYKYELPNAGMGSISQDTFKMLYRKFHEDIFCEPERITRLSKILPKWKPEEWRVYGFKPS